MLKPEFTAYPIDATSPIYCHRGEMHYLHIASRWSRPGIESWPDMPTGLMQPRRLEIGFCSGLARKNNRAPVERYVEMDVSDTSTINIDPTARVTDTDIALLSSAMQPLGVTWHFTRNWDGGAKFDVVPQALALQEPHGDSEDLLYYAHSSNLVFAGLCLLALEGVARYMAEQQ